MEKQEVCKSDMFDLRVDFCHLDPKLRLNYLEYFKTQIMIGLGLGIKKPERGCTLKSGAHLVRGGLV